VGSTSPRVVCTPSSLAGARWKGIAALTCSRTRISRLASLAVAACLRATVSCQPTHISQRLTAVASASAPNPKSATDTRRLQWNKFKKEQQQQQQQQQQHQQQQHQRGAFDPSAMAPPPPPPGMSPGMSPSIRSPNMRLTDTAIQEEFPGLNQAFRKSSIRGSVDGTGTHTDVSQLSLMSDYSNFGFESIGSISIPSAPTYGATPSTLGSAISIDRRKYFASIKYSSSQATAKSRSTIGSNNGSNSSKQLYASNRSMDGMPDIHLVESNPSLYSGMSHASGNDKNSSDVTRVFESRRSLMSGDRISTVDGASENSIFSDLSGKIGNVSTRSMAMSDFSDMSKKITTNTSTRSMALSELSGMDDVIDEIPPLYDLDTFTNALSGDNMDL